MFNLESISINFSFSGFLFWLCVLIIAAYSWYNYRYTVPQVSPSKKILLTLLRALALTIIVFIIFEPIVSYAKKNIIEPVTLVFADNSRSMKINDGTNRENNIHKIINSARSELSGNITYNSFGSRVLEIKKDSINNISFDEGSTSFSDIFNNVSKSEKNISSVVIISDGVITEGSNPVFTAEKLKIPVITIGIGDSTTRKDLEIKNLLYNEYIYSETPTSIMASVGNNGLEGKNTTVTLYENDRVIEQKNITLSSDGIQNVEFTYTPKEGGEKKLTISASAVEGEFTTANNKKIFYVNVLSNKIKVVLLSGAPSPDLSFIRDVLAEDPNMNVRSITYIGQNKILEKVNPERLIDSADILFLIGFPSSAVSEQVLTKTLNRISVNSKPFFFLLTDIVDLNRLKSFLPELPFTLGRMMPGFSDVQPNIRTEEARNPAFQNNSQSPLEAWNNLPPVQQMNGEIIPKPESSVLSGIRINNVPVNKPLILTRKLGSKRSVAVTAKDVWRWKLQNANKNSNLFDQFVMSSLKWLNTSEEQKQVSIKTSKKVYALGERIEFNAQVYDDAFNPVSDAEVDVNVNGAEKSSIILNPLGSGLYEGVFETNKPGDYTFNGTAAVEKKKLGSDNGRFNIGEVDIEMSNPRMNYEFLSSLSSRTGGKFYTYNNYQQAVDFINNLNKHSTKEKIYRGEIDLWSNEWLLSFAILLFAIEWFIRKRSGML